MRNRVQQNQHPNVQETKVSFDGVDVEIHKDENGKSSVPESSKKGGVSDLQYGIEDTPPWYLCILLGFQHYLTMFGATLAIPLIITPAMCIGNDTVGQSEVIGTIFFVCGLATLLQSTFGCRLPIVQGGTYTFLPPVFAILALPKWQCPDEPIFNTTNITNTSDNSESLLLDWRRGVWHSRMNEIQGAIITASVFQVLIGLTGMVGLLLRFIGPLAIAPTIALIGLSLFDVASNFCSGQWWIAITTMVLITLFSQYMRNINVPCCKYTKGQGCRRIGYQFFKLFPVITAIGISWGICGILTATDVLPNDPTGWGYKARTDTKIGVLSDAKWFKFPYPGQWGLPTFSVSGTFGMLAGVLAGMIESIGDYYAAARLSGAPPPPTHAINRGILVEGVGCVLAGLWGTGTGTTSYSENIGAIGITKVGSRRVIQFGGIIMVCFGMFGKFGALFVTIPEPIIGGVFMIMFGMVCAVGISNLQYVDLNSSRNLFIFGFAIIFGLSLPKWVYNNPGQINTGEPIVDQILTVLCSTSMFVGGAVGFFLDNTVPGTDEERGIKAWRKQAGDEEDDKETCEALKCYDFPFGMKWIRKMRCTSVLPFCPTFVNFCGKKPSKSETEENDNPYTEENDKFDTEEKDKFDTEEKDKPDIEGNDKPNETSDDQTNNHSLPEEKKHHSTNL